MLVLTRKAGQSIMIGEEIEISVLSVSGEKVRLGISADKETPIYRDEVYKRIAAERNGSSGSAKESEGSSDEALQEMSSGSKRSAR